MTVEYRKIEKYGRLFVEVRYKDSEWTGWLFLASKEKRRNWIYIPELNLWRSNVSSF